MSAEMLKQTVREVCNLVVKDPCDSAWQQGYFSAIHTMAVVLEMEDEPCVMHALAVSGMKIEQPFFKGKELHSVYDFEVNHNVLLSQ